jgi:hypothetical protein
MQYLYQEIEGFATSTITESTAAWNVATAYTAGQYALDGTYIYKAVTSHTGQKPSETVGIYWVKYSVSNKQAMLDLSSTSKSFVNGGNMVVTFPQNRMNTLAIGNYEAETILVEALDSDGTTVMWSYETESTVAEGVYDWWTWMYAPYGYEVDRAVKITIGVTNATTIRVTFKKFAAETRTACGFLVGGSSVSMGSTLYGVNYGFTSYAIKQTDDFGTLNIIKRAVQDKVDFNTILPASTLINTKRKIKSIYNDIIVFMVDDSDDSIFESMITLGVIESSNIVLNDGEYITMSWNVVEAL